MKQAFILALTAAAVSVSASSFEDEFAELVARFLDTTTQTTSTEIKTQSGNTGAGGQGTGGSSGPSGNVRGPNGGKQNNNGSNGGKIGPQRTDNTGANLGMNAGNSMGGSVNGNINMGAPYMFGGGMFDKGKKKKKGVTKITGPSIGNIGSSYSGISGNNGASIGNKNNSNGGTQGGSMTTTGNAESKSGPGGNGTGGGSGASSNGGGNTAKTKGGDNTNSNSLSIPAIPARRSLEVLDALQRRAFDLEDEYSWIVQQKRDLEYTLAVRDAEPDLEADDGELYELNARDLAEYYFLMASA